MSPDAPRVDPFGPSILRMAAPLVVSFWMRAGVTFVDTIYAALLGDPSVAAVGLTVPLEFLMIAVWVGLSTGLTSRLSRAMGAGDHARVEQVLRAGWRLVLAVSPLFTLAGLGVWLAAPRLDLDPETVGAFRIYGSVLIAGSSFTTFWSVIPDSLVKAHQDTRSTMWAGIWTNVINLGLNTVFLFGFGWGVFGIALSTVLGRIGGLVYAIGRARHHEDRRRAEAAEAPAAGAIALEPHPYRSILTLAVPSGLTFALMAIEPGLVNMLLARMDAATEAIAAYSIYYRGVLFALQPVIATGVAMLPFAARRFGRGDVDGVRHGLRQSNLIAAVYALVVCGPALGLGAPWIARALTESPVTAEFTTFALRVAPLACLAGGPFLLCRPVFEALGRGQPGLVMAAVRYLALTAPLAGAGFLVARGAGLAGLHGVIWGTIAAAAVSSVLFLVWVQAALGRLAADRPGPAEPATARTR